MSTFKVENINGSHVIHFLVIGKADWDTDGIDAVTRGYRRAINFASDYGGRKYHNRSYGGGIAFNCMDSLNQCVQAYESQNNGN